MLGEVAVNGLLMPVERLDTAQIGHGRVDLLKAILCGAHHCWQTVRFGLLPQALRVGRVGWLQVHVDCLVAQRGEVVAKAELEGAVRDAGELEVILLGDTLGAV